jgi:hypothetical protein
MKINLETTFLLFGQESRGLMWTALEKLGEAVNGVHYIVILLLHSWHAHQMTAGHHLA